MDAEVPLKIDLTDQEASSQARSFEAIPSGKYHVAISDIELRESNSQKNKGKPYWAVELTIQEGEFENRKLWSNVMLFNPVFNLVQMHRACGFPVPEGAGTLEVRPADDFLGQEVVVIVKRQKDTYAMDPENGGDGKTLIWKNEVKGFDTYDGTKTYDGGPSTISAGAGSLLP